MHAVAIADPKLCSMHTVVGSEYVDAGNNTRQIQSTKTQGVGWPWIDILQKLHIQPISRPDFVADRRCTREEDESVPQTAPCRNSPRAWPGDDFSDQRRTGLGSIGPPELAASRRLERLYNDESPNHRE